MESNQPTIERFSTLERAHLEKIYSTEQNTSILPTLRSFLEQPSTKNLPGLNKDFLDNFYNLVCDTPPSVLATSLWVELFDKVKSHASPNKVELLVTLRVLLTHFAKSLGSSSASQPYGGQDKEQTVSKKMSNVEEFYLEQIRNVESESPLQVADFARFMVDNKIELMQRDKEKFITILKNTQRFLTSPLTVSGYYKQMVEHMRQNSGFENDLLVLNSIILRYISSKK